MKTVDGRMSLWISELLMREKRVTAICDTYPFLLLKVIKACQTLPEAGGCLCAYSDSGHAPPIAILNMTLYDLVTIFSGNTGADVITNPSQEEQGQLNHLKQPTSRIQP